MCDTTHVYKVPKRKIFYIKRSTLKMDCFKYIEENKPLVIEDKTEVINQPLLISY